MSEPLPASDFEAATIAASDGRSDERSERVRMSLRSQVQRSTYVMAKAIIGFHDLTPHLHGEMCNWIQGPSRRKLGLVPRDHLKTSVWTIADTVRLVAADPNTRILIGNETATNASHFLRRIQAVFERATLFRWLFPELIPDIGRTKWSESEMLIPRTKDYPESTVEVIGVGGAVVSRHFKRIKLDDLVGKEASESVEVMKKTIDWYLYCESLLECPTDPIDTYGTRWTHKDLYARIQEQEEDIDFFHRKAINDQGQTLWPERFPLNELLRIKRKIGGFKFSCQYQNEPFDPEHMTFDPGWLRFFELNGWETDQDTGSSALRFVGQPKPVRVTPVILTDPAISEKSYAARSAVVCAGLTDDDRIVVLEAWADRCQPLKMIDKIFEMAARWDPMLVTVEGVAYQRALKGFIEAECQRRGRWLNVREVRPGSREGKESRIRGLQPYAERGRLWIRRSTCAVLVEEFEAFPLGETVDVLDALSYGPQVWVSPESTGTEPTFSEDDDRPLRYEGVSAYSGY
jgi:hypothetical protein